MLSVSCTPWVRDFPIWGFPDHALVFLARPAPQARNACQKNKKKGPPQARTGCGVSPPSHLPEATRTPRKPSSFPGLQHPAERQQQRECEKRLRGPKTPPLRSGSPFVIHIRLNRVADRCAFCALDTAHVHCVLVFIEDSFKEQLRVPSGNAGAGSSFFHTPGFR